MSDLYKSSPNKKVLHTSYQNWRIFLMNVDTHEFNCMSVVSSFCSLLVIALSKWRLLSAADAWQLRMQMCRRFQWRILRKKYSNCLCRCTEYSASLFNPWGWEMSCMCNNQTFICHVSCSTSQIYFFEEHDREPTQFTKSHDAIVITLHHTKWCNK